jgi:HEPN domain-containing protein
LKNLDMAADYLEEAKVSLKQAELAFDLGRYNTAVRRSQDTVEFSVKAALRLVGIEYPKEHEVSEVLLAARSRFPEEFQAKLEGIAKTSAELIPKRGLATYGDERQSIPAGKIFTRDDALEAMEKARSVLQATVDLLKAFESKSLTQKKHEV